VAPSGGGGVFFWGRGWAARAGGWGFFFFEGGWLPPYGAGRIDVSSAGSAAGNGRAFTAITSRARRGETNEPQALYHSRFRPACVFPGRVGKYASKWAALQGLKANIANPAWCAAREVKHDKPNMAGTSFPADTTARKPDGVAAMTMAGGRIRHTRNQHAGPVGGFVSMAHPAAQRQSPTSIRGFGRHHRDRWRVICLSI